ncbi:hypothetical protein THAOC_32452 [Thalassiosira oceanica]|uniref:Uncharacterized protein n=1 Tax=Thalassiosira oceanica TaxID=159749 RepID=K0RIN4_THAOC|nr:hypothetical protein THAOC_32452 [Thalassiosira oceanica]|eukprot:EJK48726.1 hypothetical protein THAOC_32452 [Thalassiosira oceanica]
MFDVRPSSPLQRSAVEQNGLIPYRGRCHLPASRHVCGQEGRKKRGSSQTAAAAARKTPQWTVISAGALTCPAIRHSAVDERARVQQGQRHQPALHWPMHWPDTFILSVFLVTRYDGDGHATRSLDTLR